MHRKTSNARKINRVFGFLFAIYGLHISGEYVEQDTVKKLKFRFVLTIIAQTSCNVTFCTVFFSVLFSNFSLSTFSLFTVVPVMCIIATLLLITLHKRSHKFCSLFCKLMNYISEDTKLKTMWMKLCMSLFIVAVYSIVFTTGSIGTVFFLTNVRKSSLNISIPFLSDSVKSHPMFQYFLITQLLLWAFYTHLFNAIVFVFCVTYCQLLTLNFKAIEDHVDKTIKSKKTVTSGALKLIYDRHQLICQWCDDTSALFAPVLSFWIAGQIVAICFLLRGIKCDPAYYSTVFIILYLSHVVREVYFLCVFNLSAADVHTQAFASTIEICKLHCRSESPILRRRWFSTKQTVKAVNSSLEQRINSISFLQQYFAKPAGINVSGFFTITRSSILSLLGLLLTYTVILLQTP